MGKIHHSSLRRGARETFQAPLVSVASGVEHVIELRKLSLVEVMAALDDSADIVAEYVTGGKPLGVVDDQPVYVSRNAAQVAATVAFAQTEFDDNERYTALEIIHLMQDNELMDCILAAYEKCQPEDSKPQDDGKGNFPKSSDNSPSTLALAQ